MSCATDDPVMLEPVVQGTEFDLQFGPDTPAHDFNANPPTVYLDPPNSSTQDRIKLTVPTDGTVPVDGSSVRFTKPPSWSAAMDAGNWEGYLTQGGASDRVELVHFVLPVVAPNRGPLS